ncbi:hypothetical protein LLB_1382 [Legionella longbeachae D-4968]|nr:hypothetical protein LLB_1382 [Legionella longbeachae D-4968]
MIRHFITREQDFIQMVLDEHAGYGAYCVYGTLSYFRLFCPIN